MPELEATQKVFEQKEAERIASLASREEARNRQEARFAANRELLVPLQEHVADLGLEEKLGDVARRMQGEYADFQLLSVNWANTAERSPLALSGFVISKRYTGSAWPNRNPSDYYFQAVLFQTADHDLDVDGNSVPLPSQVQIAIGSVTDGNSYDGGNHFYDKIAQEGEGANVAASPFFGFKTKVETQNVRKIMPVKGLVFTRNREVEVPEPHVVHTIGTFRKDAEPFIPEKIDQWIALLDRKLAAFVAKEHSPRTH